MKKVERITQKVLPIIFRLLLIFVASAIIVYIFPTKSAFKYEFRKGSYWKHENLISPFDFTILKSNQELQQEKDILLKNKKLFFDYNNIESENMYSKLTSEFPSHNKIYSHAKGLLDKLINKGIISDNELKNKSSDYTIVVVDNNIAQEHEIGEYYTIKQAYDFIEESIKNISDSNKELIVRSLINVITPNITYNHQRTQEITDAQIEDISLNKGLITQGELIIAKGELINTDKYQKILSLKKEYEGKIESKNAKYAITFGQFLLVAIALTAMFLFFKYINTEIFQDNKKILLILFVVITMIAATAVLVRFNTQYIFIAPICLTPILIRTFFDTRASLYVFLVSIVIIGFSVPNSFEFVFYQLIVGMMAIISVEHLERRSEFFKTSIIVFATYSVIYLAMTLIQDTNLKQINPYLFLYFGLNAALTLFAFPLIYIVERLFGFVSSVTLMEYSNADSKILRELSVKAPGTFQHCIQVANIAEDLIHEIGGNALLVRVGALHHDIGKIVMPSFYIENQNTGFNPHSELTYTESAEIIISHVINGVKLAHKHKLPEVIIDFIRTHHGTSKTKYFYNKQKQEFPELPIDEQSFTYRGPKPYSRELAVVMMVDSVEAASRSLKTYTEQSISNLVEIIIDDQVKDGQFDNSDITLKDIATIKDILKQKLKSIYHTRIEYPVN